MALSTEDTVLYSIIAFIVIENVWEIYLSLRQVSETRLAVLGFRYILVAFCRLYAVGLRFLHPIRTGGSRSHRAPESGSALEVKWLGFANSFEEESVEWICLR